MGKCGTADTPVYFALSTLLLGRAAAVKDFRLGLKYLTADVLPDTMQAAKYAVGQPKKWNCHPYPRVISNASGLISGCFRTISKSSDLISGYFQEISKAGDLISGHFQAISENRELISRHFETISKTGGLISACFQAISFPAVLISPSRFLISKEPELISVCKIWQK